MTKQITLASNCFNQIRHLIISGQLKPGEKLKGEYLKELLGVGMSPIREALARLANTYLVELKDKTGFRVSSLSLEEVRDGLMAHAKIECLLLKDAINFGTTEWEAQIMASLYSLSKVESNDTLVQYEYWAQLNSEFHNKLLATANSPALWKIRNECEEFKDWLTNLANIGNLNRQIKLSHAEHAALAKLSINRKTDQATELLYRHLTKGIEQITKTLSNNKIIS